MDVLYNEGHLYKIYDIQCLSEKKVKYFFEKTVNK